MNCNFDKNNIGLHLAGQGLVHGIDTPEHHHQAQDNRSNNINESSKSEENTSGWRWRQGRWASVEEDDEVVSGPGVLVQVDLHLDPLQGRVHRLHLRDRVLWVQDLNDRHVDASKVGRGVKLWKKL